MGWPKSPVLLVAPPADLIPAITFPIGINEPGIQPGDINLDDLHGVLFAEIEEADVRHKREAGADVNVVRGNAIRRICRVNIVRRVSYLKTCKPRCW